MERSTRIIRYIAIFFIVATVIGLGSWYVLLRSKEASIKSADLGRGAGFETPSFAGALGSTYSNIVSTLGSLTGISGGKTKAPERLMRIAGTPTAGIGFVGTSTLSLRFIERSTGYVFETDPATASTERITNTLIPRVYEALVGGGRAIVLRSMDDTGLATFASTVSRTPASSSPETIVPKKLPSGWTPLAFDHSGNELLYETTDAAGKALLMRSLPDGAKAKQLFSSGISGWKARWLPDGRIYIAERASASALGHAYELRSDALVPLVPPAFGLMVLPRASSTALLFNASGAGGPVLSARVDEKSSAITLPVRTIADKCVWSPSKQLIVFCAVPQRPVGEDFLDRWYRGEAHTADAWWRIDVSAGSADILHAPGDVQFDVEDPIINDAGTYIAFINAADKSAWLLRISEQ